MSLPAFVFASNIEVNINGLAVPFTDSTGAPFIDNTNHIQVPLRITMESYGCKVTWNQSLKIALIEKDGTKVEVPIGANYYYEVVSPDKKYTVTICTESVDSKTWLLGERDDRLADEIQISVTLIRLILKNKRPGGNRSECNK